MPAETDFVLIGTGLAPLVAASKLFGEGHSVLILNPQYDFFIEHSELPLDPVLSDTGIMHTGVTGHGGSGVGSTVAGGMATDTPRKLAEKLKRTTVEEALPRLRDSFPGAIPLLQTGPSGQTPSSTDGALDAKLSDSPVVRTRSHLIFEGRRRTLATGRRGWDFWEEFYVEAEDMKLHPQLLEDLQVIGRIPGVAKRALTQDANDAWGCKGLSLPRRMDIDVDRYRQGVLEFVRERLTADGVRIDVSNIKLEKGAVQFRWQGVNTSVKVKEKVLIFWTPALSSWITQLGRESTEPLPSPSVTVWEEWTLLSRDWVDLGVVAHTGGALLWASLTGLQERSDQLTVLRQGKTRPYTARLDETLESSIMNEESFRFLTQITSQILKWSWFSIRSFRPRALMHWEGPKVQKLKLKSGMDQAILVGGADGALVDVVLHTQDVCREVTGSGPVAPSGAGGRTEVGTANMNGESA